MHSQSITAVHSGVTTTIFWVGEPAGSDNGNIPNAESAWDNQWVQHYGGIDTPERRTGNNPASFTPKENPFYFALPYNDLAPDGSRKRSAGACLSVSPTKKPTNYSWCKNSWISITYRGKTAYAQWEDVGPFNEDDANYVFGSSRPRNTKGVKAGLDVSPAVRDYLGLKDVNTTSWKFVKAQNVPSGPWRARITRSMGYTID